MPSPPGANMPRKLPTAGPPGYSLAGAFAGEMNGISLLLFCTPSPGIEEVLLRRRGSALLGASGARPRADWCMSPPDLFSAEVGLGMGSARPTSSPPAPLLLLPAGNGGGLEVMWAHRATSCGSAARRSGYRSSNCE